MSKRSLAIFLCIMLLAMAVAAGCGGTAEKKPVEVETQYINIATGGTAGTYFPLGGALAEIWNKNIPNINATAQSTGASVANVTMLKEGNVEVIMVQNDITFYAATGTEMYKDKKYDDILGMVSLYPETIQIVAKADKNINTLADLKGKKVAVGAAGSGTEANARQILAAAGLTYEDIDEQFLNFADAASNLKDGNITAAFITAGFPTAAIQDIAAQHKLKILEVDAALADALIKDYPFYAKIVIPANTYKDVTTDSNTVAVMAMLATNSELSEQLVYDMVKTMYENTDRIQASHKVGDQITKENAQNGMPIKLHPGAEKYFSGK